MRGLMTRLASLVLGASLAPWTAAAPVAAQDVADPGALWLPAPAGTVLYVTQGPDTGAEGGDHDGIALYAIDLAAPDSAAFEVAASRPGVIASVRSDVPDGACPGAEAVPRPDCWSEANHVVVDHLDGTAALYLHLAQGSAGGLAVGDPVVQGEILGLSGSSGTSGDPRLHFMLMAGPADPADPPWWRQSTGPLAFADESVLDVHPDGVVGDGLLPDGPYVSSNPGPGVPLPSGEPIARPASLPARLPWAAGEYHVVATGEDLLLPDASGAVFEVVEGQRGDPVSSDTLAYPLFGGTLRYAGCARGASADLGRVVVIEREADGHRYQALHAHLSSLDPLLEAAMADAAAGGTPAIIPNDQPIGTFGSTSTAPDGTCDASDGGPDRVRVALLQDALVGPTGTIVGGTPVEPWPFVGSTTYTPLPWWSGPMLAVDLDEVPGGPRGDWARATSPDRSHVPFGEPVVLSVRVRDPADLREVRFLATYPDWPARRALRRFPGLDTTETWRVLAVCRPPGVRGEPRTTKGCRWDGDAGSAVVTFSWDPTLQEAKDLVPWLPPARAAITADSQVCVPVTLGFEVADQSGYQLVGERVRVAERCDARGQRLGRGVDLDPPTPPEAPTGLRAVCLQEEFEMGCVRWELRWRDASENEDGFRIYAGDVYLLITPRPARPPYCRMTTRKGPYLITTVPVGTQRWIVDYKVIDRAIERAIGGVDIYARDFDPSVASFNDAGQSDAATTTDRVYRGDMMAC